MPGLWAGMLLCIVLLATPAPFATLPAADAGRVVGHIFAREAYLSLALSVVLMAAYRRRRGVELGLVMGALFCTVAGYFAIQPMMVAARAGQGSWSFGQLHGASLALFGLKIVLLLVLAWRVTGRTSPKRPPSTPPAS